MFRENIRHGPISLSTFMRYLPRITTLVETKISRELPNKFSLVFDGWSSYATHFISIFASYSCSSTKRYHRSLLALSPLPNENSMNADEHIQFIEDILDVYGKIMQNFCALGGDNVSVNHSIAVKTGITLVGCASHRLNLAVNDLLSKGEILLNNINRLMIKLRGLCLSALLRKVTPLRPKLRNATRWSSSYEQLVRYKELKEFLPD